MGGLVLTTILVQISNPAAEAEAEAEAEVAVGSVTKVEAKVDATNSHRSQL